ncbi:glutamate-cysteine ligase family protein [Algoriphagus namhaensis]
MKKVTREDCEQLVEEKLFRPNPDSPSKERIGVELETIPYRKDGNKAVSPVSKAEVEQLLAETLKDSKVTRRVFLDQDGSEQLARIDFADGSNFQFEPGGQLELVSAPCASSELLRQQVGNCQRLLSQMESGSTVAFAQIGINPWFSAEELGLQLHKSRYQCLQDYLDGISPFGRQMMRQTGALHINLDLGPSVELRAKRIVLANLLAPLATAIFANSPLVERKHTGLKSFRSFLWQNLDPSRTGILPMQHLGDPGDLDGLKRAYLDLALQAPIIYTEASGGRIYPREMTLDAVLRGGLGSTIFGDSDLANHFSLLFPEVRLRGFMEIRSVDAQARPWQFVPALFYSSLCHQEPAVSAVLQLLWPLRNQIGELWQKSSYGLADQRLLRIARSLFLLAIEHSGQTTWLSSTQDQKEMIAFFEKFTDRGMSPADDFSSNYHV